MKINATQKIRSIFEFQLWGYGILFFPFLISIFTRVCAENVERKNAGGLCTVISVGMVIYDSVKGKLIAESGDTPLDDEYPVTSYSFLNAKLNENETERKVTLCIPYITWNGLNRENYTKLRNWIERTEENFGIDICDSIRILPDGIVSFVFSDAKTEIVNPEKDVKDGGINGYEYRRVVLYL